MFSTSRAPRGDDELDSPSRDWAIRESEEDGLFEVPPAISCSHCGSPSCDGCWPEGDTQIVSRLPWERRNESRTRRLLATVDVASSDPERCFGQLRRGSVGQAFAFALLCELLALSSLLALAVAMVMLLFPDWVLPLLARGQTAAVMASLVIAASAGMVLIHAAWGLLLEAGVASAGAPRDNNTGLRFGLYSCAWDVVTSPVGLLVAWGSKGFGAPALILRAARAPRPALEGYLRDCRRLTETQRHLATRYALIRGVIVFAAFILLMVAGLVSLLFLHLS